MTHALRHQEFLKVCKISLLPNMTNELFSRFGAEYFLSLKLKKVFDAFNIFVTTVLVERLNFFSLRRVLQNII